MLGSRPRRHWGHRGHWEPPDQKAVTQNPPFSQPRRQARPSPATFFLFLPEKGNIFIRGKSPEPEQKLCKAFKHFVPL